jgi:MoaA/NifB/PqqE/SkfB family radical SAM enzyme
MPSPGSRYWDDFERRAKETVDAIKAGVVPPIRRVAVFITEACNFKCSYCNHKRSPVTLNRQRFHQVVAQYGKDAIIHITGGEPSVVPWLYEDLISLKEQMPYLRLNLNTNCFLQPPSECLNRLKVSLDHWHPATWDKIVGVPGAFNVVVKHIQEASELTTTSITCTLSHWNLWEAESIAYFCRTHFPKLYAVFFSIYKGSNPIFVFTEKDIKEFFSNIRPGLSEALDPESRALLDMTLTQEARMSQGQRFIQDLAEPCWLSLTERVITPEGNELTCSHLYRDGIFKTEPTKHPCCLYGCNQRLVTFNELVTRNLKKG